MIEHAEATTKMDYILKYHLEGDVTALSVPKGAELLSAACQIRQAGEDFIVGIAAWFRADPTAPKETRILRLLATGEPIPYNRGNARFVQTVVSPGAGNVVWHLFEVLTPRADD